jgi:lysophospholipase L1-like esterase
MLGRHRPRIWVGRIALAVVAGGIALLLAEGVSRLVETPERPPGASNDLPIFLPGPEIRAPNVEGILVGRTFRTNGRGLRGPDYSPIPAPGTLRILVTGDSVTMGWGVDEEAAYPALLAELLDRANPDVRHEVLNAGIAGASIGEAMDRLEMADAAYAPDLLIYGFTANDIEGPQYKTLGHPLLRAAVIADHLRYRDSSSALLRQAWPRWVNLRERFRPSVAPYEDEILFNYMDNSAAWRAFESQLDRLSSLSRSGERCAHLLTHTGLMGDGSENHVYAAVYDQVAKAARRRGITVTQSLAAHAGEDFSALRIGWVDHHPNERGQAVLAEALAADVARLPPHCLSPAAYSRRSGLVGASDGATRD